MFDQLINHHFNIDKLTLIGSGAYNEVFVVPNKLSPLKKVTTVLRVSKGTLNERDRMIFNQESNMALILSQLNIAPKIYYHGLYNGYGVQILERMEGTVTELLKDTVDMSMLFEVFKCIVEKVFDAIDNGFFCVDLATSNFLYKKGGLGKFDIFMSDFDPRFCMSNYQETLAQSMVMFKSFAVILVLLNFIMVRPECGNTEFMVRIKRSIDIDMCVISSKLLKYFSAHTIDELYTDYEIIPKDVERIIWYCLNNMGYDDISDIIDTLTGVCQHYMALDNEIVSSKRRFM